MCDAANERANEKPWRMDVYIYIYQINSKYTVDTHTDLSRHMPSNPHAATTENSLPFSTRLNNDGRDSGRVVREGGLNKEKTMEIARE